MSQGFFNALIKGSKEVQAAQKIIKFVAYYGFITIGITLAIVFTPYASLQTILDQVVPNKAPFLVTILISLICFIFLYKKHFWAPCALLVLELCDMVLTYIETSNLLRSFGSFTFILYLSAAHATYFLKKQKTDSAINNKGNTDQES